jgi:thymidylate synthase
MNTYDYVDEMWVDVCDSILGDGEDIHSRAGPSKEIVGWSGRLMDPTFCFMFNPERRLSMSYAAGEFLWYMSGELTIDRIVHYAPQYAQFADDGEAYGAYGGRIFGKTDLDWQWRSATTTLSKMTPLSTLVDALKADPNSRQAVLPLFRASDLIHVRAKNRKDIPCTLSLQFLLRNGKLNLITTMRSNDAWLGLPYDVFCFCHLQMLVANMLDVDLGFYHHQVGSMHLYEKHYQRALAGVHTGTFDVAPMSYVPYNPHHVLERIQAAVDLEDYNRKNTGCAGELSSAGTPAQMGHNLCLMAATKDVGIRAAKRLLNPTLRRHWENHNVSD